MDARDSVRRKGEADGLGGGPGIDQVRRDDFLFVAIVTAEGLPYLVAVDAAWDNFAFPIEFDFVSAGQTWNLQGCFERHSFTLLAGQRRLVCRVVVMKGERGFERRFIARCRFVLGILLVRP